MDDGHSFAQADVPTSGEPATSHCEEDTSRGCEGSPTPHSRSSRSSSSKDWEMEPFSDYLPKIEQLLSDIGLGSFTVETLQYGYSFQNCVYALTPHQQGGQPLILRVPVCPDVDEADSLCHAIPNNVALLDHLADKLPVPRVKAYSASTQNALNAPFEIQTRLRGQSLDHIYTDLNQAEKLAIIDQFVDLLIELESVTFPTAGTIQAPSTLPDTTVDFLTASVPSISMFEEGDEEFVKDPSCSQDRLGPNPKCLLLSHINGWIAKELKGDELHQSFFIPPFRRLLRMMEEFQEEDPVGYAKEPITLYHWDLEPRNIMVKKSGEIWTICGIIDWDNASAVPRSLARKPPSWIWDFDPEMFTGYLDTDFHPNQNLSDNNLALKAYFDTRAAAALPNYLDDAYGRGRWLRRVWTLVRNQIHTEWYLDLMDQMLKNGMRDLSLQQIGLRSR